MSFLVFEIYGLAAYQHQRRCPYHHLHCVHCRHLFSIIWITVSTSTCIILVSCYIYISIIFSFESFNLGIHIICSNHSGAFRFLIRTTTSRWCPCHPWSWRLTGWQFTNVIHIVHVVVFVVFVVVMFFFIILIVVLSMVI